MKRGIVSLALPWMLYCSVSSAIGLGKIEIGSGVPSVVRPSRLHFEIGNLADECGIWRRVNQKTQGKRSELIGRFEVTSRLLQTAREEIGRCATANKLQDEAEVAEVCGLAYQIWLELGTTAASLEEEAQTLEHEQIQLKDLISANCSRLPDGVILSSAGK